MVRERFRDIEDMIDEMLEVIVDCAWKIHHMTGVSITDRRKHQDLVRNLSTGAIRDSGWANHIDIERQVMTVLLDCAAGDDADLAEVNRVIDFGPNEFFVAKLSRGAGHVGKVRRFIGQCTTETSLRTRFW